MAIMNCRDDPAGCFSRYFLEPCSPEQIHPLAPRLSINLEDQTYERNHLVYRPDRERVKASIALEELGIDYDVEYLHFNKNEQKTPSFSNSIERAYSRHR